MKTKLRELPPVCLLVSLARMITGTLKCSGRYKGDFIHMDNGNIFRIFRNIILTSGNITQDVHVSHHSCVFIVSFKFSKLSHRANKAVSLLPMMIIAGSPGFEQKLYAANPENGYWQGMYQWKSLSHLEAYKKSFIFRMMNKRAVPESIQTMQWKDQTLENFIQHHRYSQSE